MDAMAFIILVAGIIAGMLLVPIWNSTVGSFSTSLRAS
jgi:hypothetical protein